MSLELELALDRIDGALAAELPAHVRAFARAHAAGRAPPPAPPILGDAATLAIAARARRVPELARRGLALWRQVAPAVLAGDAPGAPRDWPGLAALARAREDAARRRFGRGFLAVVHEAFAAPASATAAPTAAPAVASVPAPAIDGPGVRALWARLSSLPAPTVIVATVPGVRARTFAVAPGEAIVVVPSGGTVQAWGEVAHELGHAWIAMAGLAVPRTLDETVAISAGRALEARWPALAQVRARHHAVAARLAAVEHALHAGEPVAAPAGSPPWALVHDPGAQAAYAAAFAAAWEIDHLDDLRARVGECGSVGRACAPSSSPR